MEVDKFNDIEIYQKAFEIEKIGNEAINDAIRENKEKGIPTVFSKDGKVYYLMPNGDITTEDPFKNFPGLQKRMPGK